MADQTKLQVLPQKPTDVCDDVDKMLMAVVKKRKTIPTKCMEINREISACLLQRLENAKIVTEDSEETEELRKMMHRFEKLKSCHVALEDVTEAELRLQNYYEKVKEMNCYLEKRKTFLKQLE